MDEMVSQSYGAIRFPMTLLWIFSGMALILSAVGIFGVMSYTVTQRTRELAVRMALGASRQDVLGLVLREGLWVTFLGVGVGLGGALALSRVMAQYLYGISSTDPLTLASASVLLILVAVLAAYMPARRAAKVDPLMALRYE
jgi:putative ABC transport system permease protein